MPKVVVLTVSKRDGWYEKAEESIDNQTYQIPHGCHWIIVQEGEATAGYVTEGGTQVRFYEPPKKKRRSNLNASLNEGLRHCLDADYVIFYQDFIELPTDCFEKLVREAEETGRFVTTATINHDGTMDGRYTGVDEVRPCEPAEWEANVAIAPMKAIIELGGFDEEYDNGWSWDNCNLAERAAMLGYRFCIDESNKPQLLFHQKEPDLHPDMPMNGDLHAKTMEDIRQGRKPIKLNYLGE